MVVEGEEGVVEEPVIDEPALCKSLPSTTSRAAVVNLREDAGELDLVDPADRKETEDPSEASRFC